MNRRELVLAILGAADGGRYSPAQLQKAVFLVDTNLPGIVTDGPSFNFQPYDYGPFDKTVYQEADALALVDQAQVEQVNSRGFRLYSATDAGRVQAADILQGIRQEQKDYISAVSAWVRSLSFAQLVKSIYEEYPDMRANSIFVG